MYVIGAVFLYTYRSDKCKQACQETQGIVLFGNKIKVTPLDTDGMYHVVHCTISFALVSRAILEKGRERMVTIASIYSSDVLFCFTW